MDVKRIFNGIPLNTDKYIKYYFYDMVKLPRDKKIHFEIQGNRAFSIMKDETKRILDGSGKLRERPWSNFIFYFIEKSEYTNLFGKNERKRNIVEKSIINDYYSLSGWDVNYNGKDPHKLNINKNNNYKIAKYLFDLIKNQEPSLFIRSYVYITIVLYDETDTIDTHNYFTYYFNTNYKFAETKGKRDFIYNVNYSYLVEDLTFELQLIRDNNRDMIECVKAFNGNLDYIPQTKYYLENIVSDINNGDKYILIEGAARTGKTIIAMSLLNKYEEAQLLVMNYYFYNALKDAFATLEHPFPDRRIFHQSYGIKGYYDGEKGIDFGFCIIDECQRMGRKFGLINRMINDLNHQHTILLGDDYQRLNPKSDDGLNYIIDEIIKTDNIVKKYKFNNAIGVPPEIVKNVKFLLGVPEMKNPYPIGEYSINIFDNQKDFLDAYDKDMLQRKHLSTIQVAPYNFSDFGKYKSYPKKLINSDYPYFLNKETINNYYFSAYEMISRELDSMYIFVRRNITKEDIENYILTHLYVLMTRAIISLNIYFENNETRDSFNTKVQKIMEFSHMELTDFDDIEEGRQFFIKEDLVDDFVLKYDIISPKNDMKNRFITRLVHFTDSSNIENIIKYGLVPRNHLSKNAIESVFNDEIRLEGHQNSICLSVENPNDRLLKSFKRKYPDRKYKLITINPAILYSSFIMTDSKILLTKRYYCNYNAAANTTLKSEDDLNIMYSEVVQTYHITFTRHNLPENVPTSTQAEILFFGIIPPEFIDSIEDI